MTCALHHLDATTDPGRRGKPFVDGEEVGPQELSQSDIGSVVGGEVCRESPDAFQKREVPVALNRSLHELAECSFGQPRADRLLRDQASQDVRELQVDQGRRGNRCFCVKSSADRTTWAFIDDCSNPNPSVGDDHLAPAARNQIHDFSVCQWSSVTQPRPSKDLPHALGRDMLSQYVECVGRQRHVDLISSLAKAVKYWFRHIPDLQRLGHA